MIDHKLIFIPGLSYQQCTRKLFGLLNFEFEFFVGNLIEFNSAQFFA